MTAENKTADPTVEILTGMGAKITAHETALKAMTEKGLTPEVLDAGLSTIKELKADMERFEKEYKPRLGLKGLEAEKRKFNFGGIAVAYHKNRGGAEILKAMERPATEDGSLGFEGEVLSQFHKSRNAETGWALKDIVGTISGAGGGVMLPTEIDAITPAAREKSQLFKLGAKNPTYDGFGAVVLPRETTIFAPDGTSEGKAAPVSAPKFEPDTVTPKKVAGIVGISEEYLRMGGGTVQQHVMEYGPKDLANKLEYFCLNGNGAGGQNAQPLGLFAATRRAKYSVTTSSKTIGTTTGRAMIWADFVDMQDAIDTALRLEEAESPAALIHRRSVKALRTAFANLTGGDVSNSLPIVAQALFGKLEAYEQYTGYKIARTSYIPTNFPQGATGTAVGTGALFGDFGKIVIPFWGPLVMRMSDVATVDGVSAFQNGAIFMIFSRMYDLGVKSHDALTVTTGYVG